jgi:hypothetical protein
MSSILKMAMMILLLMMMLLSSLEEKGQRQWGRGRLHQTMTVDLVVLRQTSL